MATLSELRDQVRAALVEGDPRRALFLAKLIQLHSPQDNEALELLGQGYAGVGRLLEARRLFERVLEVDPENGSARWDLASILEQEGEAEAALEQMEQAWEGGLRDYQLMENIQRLHSQLSPGWPLDVGSSRYARANGLLAEGRYGDAIPIFKEAVRIAPNPEAMVGMSLALWHAGRVREAEVVARNALREHPDCLKALAIMAGATAQKGEDPGPWLASCSTLNPGNGVARPLFDALGIPFPDSQEGVEIPDEVVAELMGKLGLRSGLDGPAGLGPEDAYLLITFGRAYEARGWGDRAVSDFRMALRLNPLVADQVAGSILAAAEANSADPNARWLAGDALASQGRYREAMRQYMVVLEDARPPEGQPSGSSHSEES